MAIYKYIRSKLHRRWRRYLRQLRSSVGGCPICHGPVYISTRRARTPSPLPKQIRTMFSTRFCCTHCGITFGLGWTRSLLLKVLQPKCFEEPKQTRPPRQVNLALTENLTLAAAAEVRKLSATQRSGTTQVRTVIPRRRAGRRPRSAWSTPRFGNNLSTPSRRSS